MISVLKNSNKKYLFFAILSNGTAYSETYKVQSRL